MSRATALRVFLPFALGYYMSYVYRAINAVIAPDLVRDFALNAGDLGLLTSTYFPLSPRCNCRSVSCSTGSDRA
jgi:sugar phosphate permease